MRRIAKFRNGADYKDVEVSEGGYPVYGSGGEFRRASEFLYEGDSVLFGRKGTINRPLLVSGRFWTVDTMFFTELSIDVEPRFLYYYASTMPFDYYSTNTTLPSMTQGELGGHRMPLPPVCEQRAIADFLDRETARIDKLIAEQQQLIDLLQERREAVVDLTLTRHGFEVPAHFEDYHAKLPVGWRVILLGRTLQQLTNGFVGPTRDILVDQGIRYIQGTHIKAGRIDFDRRPFYVSRDWHEQRPRIHLRAGDVLIVQTGDIGKVAVVPPDFGEASCHALQIARTHPEILSGEYLSAFLSSRLGYQSLLSRATGALHPHLEAGIRSAPIVLPPLETQDRIVIEVVEQTAKIDDLVTETEKFIELSRERRAALITAAVTGQIDVRAEAA